MKAVRTCRGTCRRRAGCSGRRCSPRARCRGTRRRRRTRRAGRSGPPESPRRPPPCTSAIDLPVAFARASIVVRSRSVSKEPGSRLLIVTLWARDLAREPGDEAGEPGARAVGQAEDVDRRLHRGRRDVDDAAEPARDHAVDGRLDELDRRQHVGVERADPRRAVPVAEVAGRRSAGVVDQDVGLGTRGERRGAALRRRDVARDPAHRAAGSAPISSAVRRSTSSVRATIVTSQPASRERLRAAAPQPLARRADERALAGDAEVHGVQAHLRASAVRRDDARRTRMTVPIATQVARGDAEKHLAADARDRA